MSAFAQIAASFGTVCAMMSVMLNTSSVHSFRCCKSVSVSDLAVFLFLFLGPSICTITVGRITVSRPSVLEANMQ
jgi:hypothetical protein